MSTENINFFIKILALNNYKAVKIRELLANVLGEDVIQERRVQVLCKEFKNGERDDVERQIGSGHPRTLKTQENINRIEQIIQEDDKISIRDIAEQTDGKLIVV